jgi:hypothetical protein
MPFIGRAIAEEALKAEWEAKGYTVYFNVDMKPTYFDDSHLSAPVLWDDGWHPWGYMPPPRKPWWRRIFTKKFFADMRAKLDKPTPPGAERG